MSASASETGPSGTPAFDSRSFEKRWSHVFVTGRKRPGPAAEERAPAPSVPGESAWTEFSYTCERCGSAMEEEKCKIVCKSCGCLRDCGDP